MALFVIPKDGIKMAMAKRDKVERVKTKNTRPLVAIFTVVEFLSSKDFLNTK